MSLYQCEECGCCENTALSNSSSRYLDIWPDGFKGRKLCSACGPTEYRDGTKTKYGKWHGVFKRVFLPVGQFRTNREGNLAHIESGSTNYREHEVHPIMDDQSLERSK